MSNRLLCTTAIATLLLAGSVPLAPSFAQEADQDAVNQRIEKLEKELAELKAMVKDTADTAEHADMAAADAKKTAEQASGTAQSTEMKPVAYGAVASDTSWHLAGYATAGLVVTNSDESDSFLLGNFNPVFHFQYKDLILFEGELEFELEDGETNVELEYASMDLLLHDNLTLVIGKFLSPIGQFQERLHPAWINKAASRPAGFGHEQVEPGEEIGVQIRGGVPVGEGMKATYSLYIGNGPQVGEEGNVELEGFPEDNNNNKSFGGRIGFFPLPYLEVGGSFITAKVDGLEGTGELMPTRADFQLWGFDSAFTKGPWDVRFEFVKSTRDPFNSADDVGGTVEFFDKQSQKAWYAQAAYRLSDVTDNIHLQRMEPVFRYGQFRATNNEEFEEVTQNNYYIGLNYWLAPSFVVRGGYEIRDFTDSELSNEKLFQLQVSYGF